jgi:TonB family protein
MLRKLSLYVSACSTVAVILFSPVVSAQDEQIKALVRDASKECRTAKLLRRDDLKEAEQHFNEYTNILKEALKIKPDLLDSPDPSTQRVLEFCNVVKNDLDRAKALPLFEQGLRECSEARVAISNAAFDDAREKYNKYNAYKEAALAISESVLDVHENSYEVRLCDRLASDIGTAEAEYRGTLGKESVFQGVVSGFDQADRQCRGTQNIIDDKDRYNTQTVAQVERLVADVEKLRQAALAERKSLTDRGSVLDAPTARKIESAQASLNECLASIPAGITRIKTTMAARAQASAAAGTAPSRQGQNSELRQIVGAPPQYPRRALERGIQGSVTVKFTVTSTGDVKDIQITESEPKEIFDRAALSAVEKYKYQPRIVNGEPVESKDIVKKLVFKLQ